MNLKQKERPESTLSEETSNTPSKKVNTDYLSKPDNKSFIGFILFTTLIIILTVLENNGYFDDSNHNSTRFMSEAGSNIIYKENFKTSLSINFYSIKEVQISVRNTTFNDKQTMTTEKLYTGSNLNEVMEHIRLDHPGLFKSKDY